MKHTLPELPFSDDALAPVLSKETIEYHYRKHHQTYIDNLNRMIEGSPYENMPLEEIVTKTGGVIFNNAAQAWNHTFYFESLCPSGTELPERLSEIITKDFGSFESFKSEFTNAAATLFGSGWVWLSEDKNGKLVISQESNADNPLSKGNNPLLTIDLWEHAYYIDYRNKRASYIDAWWTIVNWEKVAERLKG